MHLVFDVNCICGGEFKALSEMHPQKAMGKLGIKYQIATPQSVADKWWFWNCENIPSELPPFLRESKVDPMNHVGFGLSQEEAQAIRDCEGASSDN